MRKLTITKDGVRDITFKDHPRTPLDRVITLRSWYKAYSLFRERLDWESSPDVVTYNPVSAGMYKAQTMDKAELFPNRMVKDGVSPNCTTYTILEHGHCFSGQMAEVVRIFKKVPRDGPGPNVVTCNYLLMDYLCKNGRCAEARNMFDSKVKKGPPSVIQKIRGQCMLFSKFSPYSAMKSPAVKGVDDMFEQINTKLGGINSLLQIETSPAIPLISKVPTIILGMDVSHGSPEQSEVPTIAAVVSSGEWPLISKYRASVRSQSPKLEMMDSLFKPQGTGNDGLVRELLIDFYTSSGKRKPDQIIIFWDGINERQSTQVLNIELDQIIEACKFLDENWSPKFTLIVAQKNHHTKFFLPGSPYNVSLGPVVDNVVSHPKNCDFYMCSHAGMIGITRPTHYHILYDENCMPRLSNPGFLISILEDKYVAGEKAMSELGKV